MKALDKLQFYRKQSRECAALARRKRYMERDSVMAELWAERALASFLMVRCEVAARASQEKSK